MRSFAVACLALAILGLPAATRCNWEAVAKTDGPSRKLVVRRHQAVKRSNLAVVFSDYMKTYHSRVVAFVNATTSSSGISVLESSQDAQRRMQVLSVSCLQDAFQIVAWVHVAAVLLLSCYLNVRCAQHTQHSLSV